MANSKGRKPRPPVPKKPAPKIGPVQFIDRANFLWSLLPANVVALVTAVVTALFGMLAGLNAWQVVLIGLTALLLSSLIFKYLPTRIAWGIIIALLALASFLAYRQYNSYKLEFQGVQLARGFLPTDRTMIAVVGVELLFGNKNNFDIWMKSNRRISSVNGATNTVNTDYPVKKVVSGTMIGLVDDLIVFPQPLHPTQIVEGTFDYNICYGKTEDQMDKSFSVSGLFAPQFTEDGEMSIVVRDEVRKEGSCNE